MPKKMTKSRPLLQFCRTCKFYRPNKKGTPKFIFGYWSGDGRCENEKAWNKTEYPYPKPHNITVETSSCEHYQPKKYIQDRIGQWHLEENEYQPPISLGDAAGVVADENKYHLQKRRHKQSKAQRKAAARDKVFRNQLRQTE